jgi:hypothetical protein
MKKILFSLALTLITTGYALTPTTLPVLANEPKLAVGSAFLNLDGGYSWNYKGKYAYAITAGYKYSKYMGVEAGYLSLLKNNKSATPTETWVGFGGLRLGGNLFQFKNTDIYTEIGFGYNNNKLHGDTSKYWLPLYGIGIDLASTNALKYGVHYYHLPGYRKATTSEQQFQTHSRDIVMLSLSYQLTS